MQAKYIIPVIVSHIYYKSLMPKLATFS